MVSGIWCNVTLLQCHNVIILQYCLHNATQCYNAIVSRYQEISHDLSCQHYETITVSLYKRSLYRFFVTSFSPIISKKINNLLFSVHNFLFIGKKLIKKWKHMSHNSFIFILDNIQFLI